MIKKVKKIWGSEEWLVNNDKYCAKYLNLVKGFRCSLHYHAMKDETFYILEGIVKLELEPTIGTDLVTYKLVKGEQIRIYPWILHRFTSLSKTAKILEVSTTHKDEDSYRKEKSGPVK